MNARAKKITAILFAILIGCSFLGCYSTQQKRASYFSDVDKLFLGGEFAKALDVLIKKSGESKKKDDLLFLLEEGTILFNIGQYPESLKVFLQASNLIEVLSKANLSGQNFFLSDPNQKFVGENFEHALVNTYIALNYLVLGKDKEAIIYFRKTHALLQRMRATDLQYKQNSATRLLHAFLAEELGRFNDARVEYNNVKKVSSLSGPAQQYLDELALIELLQEKGDFLEEQAFKGIKETQPEGRSDGEKSLQEGRASAERGGERKLAEKKIYYYKKRAGKEEENSETSLPSPTQKTEVGRDEGGNVSLGKQGATDGAEGATDGVDLNFDVQLMEVRSGEEFEKLGGLVVIHLHGLAPRKTGRGYIRDDELFSNMFKGALAFSFQQKGSVGVPTLILSSLNGKVENPIPIYKKRNLSPYNFGLLLEGQVLIQPFLANDFGMTAIRNYNDFYKNIAKANVKSLAARVAAAAIASEALSLVISQESELAGLLVGVAAAVAAAEIIKDQMRPDFRTWSLTYDSMHVSRVRLAPGAYHLQLYDNKNDIESTTDTPSTLAKSQSERDSGEGYRDSGEGYRASRLRYSPLLDGGNFEEGNVSKYGQENVAAKKNVAAKNIATTKNIATREIDLRGEKTAKKRKAHNKKSKRSSHRYASFDKDTIEVSAGKNTYVIIRSF